MKNLDDPETLWHEVEQRQTEYDALLAPVAPRVCVETFKDDPVNYDLDDQLRHRQNSQDDVHERRQDVEGRLRPGDCKLGLDRKPPQNKITLFEGRFWDI